MWTRRSVHLLMFPLLNFQCWLVTGDEQMSMLRVFGGVGTHVNSFKSSPVASARGEFNHLRMFAPVIDEDMENEYVETHDDQSAFTRFNQYMDTPANVVKAEEEMEPLELFHHLMSL